MARVLHVLEPPDGGVAMHVAHLALHLAQHGHQVEVAGPSGLAVAADLRASDIPLHQLELRRGYGRPDRDAAVVRRLIGLIRTGNHDLVHCHSSKAGALGRVSARIARVPAIYTPNCFGWEGDVPRSRKAMATVVEWVLGRCATAAIICVCEAERQSARDRRVAPARRLWRVFQAVAACEDVLPEEPALVRLKGDGVLAGAVTVLRPQKRVDLLIDAAPSVLERVPTARIVVVGNGELRDELEERARLRGLDGHPRFALVPFRPPSSRYLQSLDLFVLPSAWEAMPLAVLEAMSCGVPQVATDVGGTREAVDDHTGRVIPPGDALALSEAMVELLLDSERRAEMAAVSRARFHERGFTVERMVAETAQVYDEVLAEASERR